jgi:hypothetical protein
MAMLKSENSKASNPEEIESLKKKVELLEKEIELAKSKDALNEATGKSAETDEEIYRKSKVFYKWQAPMRVFVKRDRRWFFTAGLIALLLIFFLVIVDKPLLIAVILATLFLLYVLATTKPEILVHEITNKGIYTLKKLYKWSDLNTYWFVNIDGQDVLYVDTKLRFTPRLILLVGEGSMKEINNALQEYLPYRYAEKQSKLSIRLDGKYIPVEDLPGKKPGTNKGEL